jgi:hypothetical protein
LVALRENNLIELRSKKENEELEINDLASAFVGYS